MQRHPAKRAHILAFVGAGFLIITLGSTVVKLGNQLIHYENVNHESASAANYMYHLQSGVSAARACYYEYNATHSSTAAKCYNNAVTSILDDYSDFSFYRAIELRADTVRPKLIDLIQKDLQIMLSWPHSVDVIPLYDAKVINELDQSFTTLYHQTSRDYTVRIVDIVRASSWQRFLGILGGLIGVISLLSAGWILDRALLGEREAETSSRHLARRLRAVLDNLTIGVAVFGSDGRLWHWNSQFGKLLGLKEGFLHKGISYNALSVMLVSDGMPLPEPFETIEQQLAGGCRISPEVVEYKRGDGSEIELGRNLFFDADDPTSWCALVVTVSDITMRLRSERAMGEGQKLRAIGQLTAGIVHDFKNYLTIILGNIELAQQTQGEGGAQKRDKFLRVATDAVEHSVTLTQQLLGFTRRKNSISDVLDVQQLFSFVSELLERVMGSKIRLNFHVAPGIWCVSGDGAQLECVLINLAINGRDAMPQGGQLNISACNIELALPTYIKHSPSDGQRSHRVVSRETPLAPGKWVRIDVTDTGDGMSQQVMDKLFVPFFTTKGEGKGTGLGMAMVLSSLKEVDGCLMVESAPGQGTCVSLWLLAIKCVTEPVTHAHPSLSQEKGPQKSLSTPKDDNVILVLEDDPGICHIVASILASQGYVVEEAHTVNQAQNIWERLQATIALLITDIQLPGPIDGLEFSRQVRRGRPHLPVIYMSGNISLARSGLKDALTLSKPFGRSELIRVVEQALGGTSL